VEITKSGSQPSAKGPADWFTGSVRIDSPFQRPVPARVGGATVTFEPGARTAWHTHPLGQTLIVTAGRGRVQRDGGPIEEIRAGDVVWFGPGERHWHGASPTTAMTPIAIAEMLDGKVVEWMEHVTDEQYGRKPASGRGLKRLNASDCDVQIWPVKTRQLGRGKTVRGRLSAAQLHVDEIAGLDHRPRHRTLRAQRRDQDR
jgi:quercetin dioxygenase-like cupin family protein